MQSLYSFANHVGSLSTHAVETRTHRFHSHIIGAAHRYASTKPSKFLICNPALLSARRRYPHSAFAASVNDRKTPFSIKFQNIGVGNQFSSQRVNNLNHIIAQDKFWSKPADINQSKENCAERQFVNHLASTLSNPETINSKESDQDNGSTRPSKIAAGSKGFIHHPSIAGERK